MCARAPSLTSVVFSLFNVRGFYAHENPGFWLRFVQSSLKRDFKVTIKKAEIRDQNVARLYDVTKKQGLLASAAPRQG